jgi:VWFA-related protein
MTTLAVLCAIAVPLAGQRGRGLPPPTPPPAPQTTPPRFRSGVDLVHLDVSVLDRNRRPVRGLTPADFTILENGAPQQVAVFNAVDIPDAPPPPTAWMRDVAPDVRTNDDLQERRLFLILIDDAAIQANPFAMKNVREVAKKFIDRFGPSDLAAVVFTRDNRNSQDFTSDRARLIAAVDKFTVGFRDMGGPNDLYFTYSVGVVQSAVEMLTNLPDRRKAILYIGQGVPVDLEAAAAPAAMGLTPGGASAIATAGANSILQQRMSAAFTAASRANVNVYTVDACGLRVMPPPPPPPPTCIPGLEVEYLRTVAGATGGRAIVDTNDFAPGVAAIFEENASYYLLGYQSSNPTKDGKLRRLEVRVNRPGVTVRTRSGYEAEKQDDEKRKAALAASPLGAALSGVLPKSDLPMQLSAVPFAQAGKKEAAVLVILGVRQPIRPSEARVIEKVDLQVSAFNVDGKLFGTTRLRADVTVRAGATGLAEYEVLARLDLKPGRYQLRTAANVGSTATSGSLYYDVDVPDFAGAAVSLSGLVVSATPSPPLAPRGGLAGVIPVSPTTRRLFGAGDRAAAFVRVYQGGKGAPAAVPLRVRILDATGAAVMDQPYDLPAPQFTAARSADVRIDLPVTRLRPGDYLLSIDAALGTASARRESRFAIR